MPIYEYRCERGHTFEAFQAMSDDPLSSCEVCDAAASRVLRAPAVHFKGSGFYTTDYARKGAKKAASDGGTEPAESKTSDSKTSDSKSGSKSGGEAAKAGSKSSEQP